MKKIAMFYFITFGIVLPLFGCPICVDRIKDLQEPFFYKKTEVSHE